MFRFFVLFTVAWLGGCSGSQSVLDPASKAAARITNLWWPTLVVAVLVTVLVVALLGLAISRARLNRAEYALNHRQSRNLVIAGGILLPLATTLPFALSSFSIGSDNQAPASEDALTVEVVGKLWWWEIHYLNDAGERLATTANELHVPVGKPVRIELTSDNVIHSFWAPNLQGKADMVPGQTNATSLQADRAGVFRGQCAEFCGDQHALMRFLLVAESEQRFEQWLTRQRQPAAEPETTAQERGQEVFFDAGCADCHALRGTGARGDAGPDLTHLGGRLTLAAATVPNRTGALGGWITDPQRIKPGSTMPATELAPRDLRDLISYLESLR